MHYAIQNASPGIRTTSDETQDTFSAVIDSAWDGIVFQNLAGEIFEVNHRFCAMTAFSRDELIGRTPPYPYWPEEEATTNRRFLAEMPAGKPVERNQIFKRKAGERFPVLTSVAPILDASRKPAGHVLTVKDVSERKRAESAELERARVAEFHRDIALVFTGGRRLREVLQRCAEAMAEHLNAALARIWTMNPEEGVLELEASAGIHTGIDGSQSRIPAGKLKIGTIALERRPQLINNVTDDPLLCDPEWARRENIRAFAGYPLVLDNRLVGAIGLFARQPLDPGVLDHLSSTAVALAQEISRKQGLARLEARNRQQAAVARLGQIALGRVSLDALLDQSVRLVAGALEVEYAKILELLPDGEMLLLRAGVGWKKNAVGITTVSSVAESQAGYTLAGNEPVIVDDLQSETRFSAPPLLRDHGVRSGMSVVIKGDQRPFGILGAHAASRRRFTEDDVHFLQAIANILAEAIERERATVALRRSNRMLQILSQCNEALARGHDETSFLNEICRIIAEIGNYRLAWIGLAEDDNAQSVRPVARAGAERGYIDAMGASAERSAAVLGPTAAAIRTREVAFARDIARESDYAPWHNEAQGRRFACSVAVPIICGDRAIGALNVYALEPDAFDPEEVRLLRNLADDVAFGLVALRDKAKRRRTEQALKEREEHFRALIENGTELITVLDRAGAVRYQSPSFERALGYDRDELLNRNMFDLVHPDDLESVLRVFATTLQNEGSVYRSEYRIRHKDGTWRYMESIGRSLLNAPPIRGVIINSHDVTDRKRTERLLHLSEENLRQVTDNINQVFWLTDPGKSEMVYISPAYEEIWGRTRASLCAAPISWVEAIHPDDRARVVRAAMAKQAFGDYDEQYRILRPDSSIRWIRDRAFPVHDTAGKTHRIAGIAEDITERKQTETALAERERQLSTIISNLPGLVYRCRNDADYTMEFISDGVADLTGYPAEDFRTRRRRFGDLVHSDDKKKIWKQIQTAVGDGRPFELTYRIQTAADTEKWVWERGIGVRDASGKLQALEGFITDISELKGAEQALRSAYAELKKSNTIKTQFLSVMSHELRTPLNVIMGYTAMVREAMTEEAKRSNLVALQKIEGQAKELLGMINGIMQATAVESGTARAEIEDIDANALLGQLRSMYEYARDKDLALIWDCPSSLPVLRTDPDKLKHILQNLINNAIKFTERGAVTVSARITEGKKQSAAIKGARPIDARSSAICPWSAPRFVAFSVSDTGIGIATENLAVVFEMFHQVDSSASREYEGIGLGLYIVKKYTEVLGGTIEVESEPGKGSTFTFILPIDPF